MLTLNLTEPSLWTKVRAHPSICTRSLALIVNGRQPAGSKFTAVRPVSVWSHFWNANYPGLFAPLLSGCRSRKQEEPEFLLPV